MTARDWAIDAACKGAEDADRFFPTHASWVEALAVAEQAAREFCDGCPVFAACRDYADQERHTGVWSGSYRSWRQRKAGGGRATYERTPLLDDVELAPLTSWRGRAAS